jgi:hypothetical protein
MICTLVGKCGRFGGICLLFMVGDVERNNALYYDEDGDSFLGDGAS